MLAARESAPRPLPARPSLDDVWCWVPLLGIGAYLLCVEIRPHDFWWHLRSGQQMLEEGQISSVDRFSFTRSGEVWINQSWLVQLTLYRLYDLGGLTLVRIAHALGIAGGYALLMLGLRRAHGAPAAALAGLVAFALGIMSVGVRPQLSSFLCFGGLVCAIELHRQGQRAWLRWTPLLFAFWVNAHGAFVFGGLVLGFYVLGRSWELRARLEGGSELRELWLVGAAALAALALNPEGPRGVVAYFAGFFAHGTALASVEEFQPLQIRHADGVIFFAVLAGSALALWRTRLHPTSDQIATLLAFGFCALYARRFAAWYGFALAPALAPALAELFGRSSASSGQRTRSVLYLALGVTALIAAVWLRLGVYGNRALSIDTPVAATAELCRTAAEGARVFQPIGFASYQVFACPRLPVFVDTRIELYPQALWVDYTAASEGRHDWEQILERWGITYVLVPSEGAYFGGVRAAAQATPSRWSERHRDPTAILFERSASR